MRTRLYPFIAFVIGAFLLLTSSSLQAQTNLVPDNVELAALKALYDEMGGAGWVNKLNWPSAANWPATATAAQMDAWAGIDVANGDITKIILPQRNMIGIIPAKLGDLKALTVLDLNTNPGITGSMPASLWTITTLQELKLYSCNISGSIAPELFNLPNLKILNLNVNKLSGTLPSNMGSAIALTSLGISSNANITGPLPTSIGSLVNLTLLQIENTQVSGSIPTTIGNLENLTYLKLNSNKLTGSIPTEIGNLKKLVTGLYLNNNLLTGSIPSTIGELKLLKLLDISTNQLTGSIPSTIGNLTQLTSLVAAYNQLTGSIPSTIGSLNKLTTLDISYNKLTGEIPTTIGLLTSLTTLYLQANTTLTGSIPAQIGSLKNLTALYLQGNQLYGPIPYEIGNLDKLTVLYLHLNSLSGSIPASLGKLTNLTNLYLYSNQLSGELPASLGKLIKLKQFWASSNQLSGTLPSQLSGWTLLTTFNIGYNQFSGEIPESLFSAWTQLATLSIEWNAFSGAFPSTISSCTLLTTLNAHYNGFTSLPASMLTLPAITTLMANNNKLTAIPNFAGQVNKVHLTMNVRNNYLDFSHLEGMVGQGIKSATLVPLNNINDLSSTGYKPGSPLIVPARPTGINSTVTWEKQAANGTWSSVNALNQDATQKTFLRNVPVANDNGYYRWKMTNTLFSGTTLFSEPIYVGELSTLEESKTLYNGLITAASWRTETPLSSLSFGEGRGEVTGMYLYDYDEKYQLKEAVFANPDFTAGTYTLAGNNYRLAGMEYDPNGNIQKLKRYKGNGQIQHDFGYTYIPNTNQLTGVSTYAGYEYNKIGQTTKVDKVANHEKDQYIDYDVTGKVVAVFEDLNKTKVTTRYTYDDRGFRLTKADFDSKGKLTKTYWYIRDASGNVLSIYEQTGVDDKLFTDFKQTEVPIYGAGKIGTYYTANSIAADQAQVEAETTAYEITDHLGNVRAVVRVKPNEYTATMEDDGTTAYTNPRVRENVYFQNIFETEKRDAQMNHTPDDGDANTPAPNTSSYLYWINGQAGITPDKKSVGPATALLVNPGDKLDVSAWARYKIKTSYSKTPLNSIIATVLASNFALSNGMETVAQATTKFNEALLVNLLSPASDEPDRPYAYINYIIFDSNNVPITRDAKRVPLSAGFDEAQRGNGYSQDNLVKFDSPILIQQPGFIYIWVSNETENTEVWFDDVSVMHYKGVVTQATDYGAWGEVMREQRLDLASGELATPLLKDNIQANYQLDGNAQDAGPNALNGTVTGATPTTDKDNQPGKAYSFSGTSRIDLPGTAQKLSFIQNSGVFTFSVFMKVGNVDPATIYCPVGNAVSSVQKGFFLSYGTLSAGSPRQVGFSIMRGVSGSSVYAKSTTNSIIDTGWHHIAVVGDGTT
ncbi:MAG: hypothetical protein HOP30_22195, partial [Cyclobacteriaceae bacterium]|nr:hypothetical protein [Cyclobacteriaceae bacterium]